MRRLNSSSTEDCAIAEQQRYGEHAFSRLGYQQTRIALANLVLPVRIELTTSPLPRGCSTTELRQRADGRPDAGDAAAATAGDHCHRAGKGASTRVQSMIPKSGYRFSEKIMHHQ